MTDRQARISPQVVELIALYRDTMNAIEAGQDREGCLQSLELGLKCIYPPVPDSNPRLWKDCYRCDDTGFEIIIRHPAIYGGRTPIRVAVPCVCPRGDKQAHAIEASREKQQTKVRPGQKTGSTWRKT